MSAKTASKAAPKGAAKKPAAAPASKKPAAPVAAKEPPPAPPKPVAPEQASLPDAGATTAFLAKAQAGFVLTITWAPETSDETKSLVLGNLNGFIAFVAAQFSGEVAALEAASADVTKKLQAADDELARQLEERRQQLAQALASLGDAPQPQSRNTPPSERTKGSGNSAAPPTGLVRVRVTGPKSGRRRAGHHFGEEAQEVEVTADALAQIESDPSLTHEVISFAE